MKVAAILENDIVNSDSGICVSLWISGCENKCKNCHNQELWNFDYGTDYEKETVVDLIKEALSKNNIKRNFSVLGGEPLHPKNIENVRFIISQIRKDFPKIKIYLWTGYVLEDLQKLATDKWKEHLTEILSKIDVLIDGPYIDSQRDIRLPLRGSRNQRILKKENNFKESVINAS